MLVGAVNAVQPYERALKSLVDGGAITAGYRPRGTLRQVLDWYVDAIDLGIIKLNSDAAIFAPQEAELPLFNF